MKKLHSQKHRYNDQTPSERPQKARPSLQPVQQQNDDSSSEDSDGPIEKK